MKKARAVGAQGGYTDLAEALCALLTRYGLSPTSESGLHFQRYLELLCRWSERINLVGSTRWEVLGPLFEEAIWACGFYPRRAALHLDIGSGAGFPALPLRILLPEMTLEMVESRSRRAVFLESVLQDLGLSRASVLHGRLESLLSGRLRGRSWDCLSWKGVRLGSAGLRILVEASRPGTLFWIFHGEALPVEDPVLLADSLRLRQREACPAKPAWRLSIYEK